MKLILDVNATLPPGKSIVCPNQTSGELANAHQNVKSKLLMRTEIRAFAVFLGVKLFK